MVLITQCMPRLLTCRQPVSRLAVAHFTSKPVITKEAAGPFTSNNHIIARPVPGDMNKTLVYIGPFADTIQRYKMVASLFGVCGLCAVPALLSTGQAPVMSLLLTGVSAVSPAFFIHWYTKQTVTRLIVYSDVKTVERQRRRPREISSNQWVGIERCSLLGRLREDTVLLSEIQDVSRPSSKAITWQHGKQKYTLEKVVMEADPYLQGLMDRCQKKQKQANVA